MPDRTERPLGEPQGRPPDSAPIVDDGFSSRRERRLWLIVYVATFVLIAVGAVRIMIKQFG